MSKNPNQTLSFMSKQADNVADKERMVRTAGT